MAVVALGACEGQACDYDSDCYSNSCTYGTCDLVNRHRGQYTIPAPPPSEPTCQQKVDCTWLLIDQCKATPGCQPTFFCDGFVECNAPFDNCPEICPLRSDKECTGACSLSYSSCESVHDCTGLDEESCKATSGCMFR